MRGTKEFSSPRVSFYSSDCVIGWNYYTKFLVFIILPISYITIATLVLMLVSLCYVKKRKKKIQKFNSVILKEIYTEETPNCIRFFLAWSKTAIVIGTFLCWPTVVEKSLEIMNCENIGDKYYLAEDLSIECYTSKHYSYLIIGYISLIVYGIGIPLLGFKLLYKYRYHLFELNDRYDGSTPLSFLFLGYREKRWYYEFIIMFKKAGLIIISVFLVNYPRYQLISANLLIQISFFMHLFLKPYDNITKYGIICNKLESISLVSLVMTLSTGLFFGTVQDNYKLGLFENVLIIMVLLANGSICMYFFIYFCVLLVKTIKSHFKDALTKNPEKLPLFLRCCSKKNIGMIKRWSMIEMTENYGINLKTNSEKNFFNKFYISKDKRLEKLKNNIVSKSNRKEIDKTLLQMQVLEKERCWSNVKYIRIYLKLLNQIDSFKNKLNSSDFKKFKDMYLEYFNDTIEFNRNNENMFMTQLNKIDYDINTEKNLIISPVNITYEGKMVEEVSVDVEIKNEVIEYIDKNNMII